MVTGEPDMASSGCSLLVLSDLLWSVGGATQKLCCECTRCALGYSPERCLTCLGDSTVSHPGYAGYAAPYLTVFSENAIDVFDVRRAEWVQTVPLKKVSAGTSLMVQ